MIFYNKQLHGMRLGRAEAAITKAQKELAVLKETYQIRQDPVQFRDLEQATQKLEEAWRIVDKMNKELG